MESSTTSFQPQDVSLEGVDCLWFNLTSAEEAATLFKTPSVQEWDWKLRGQLARILLDGPKEGATFVPTLGKLPPSFVVIDRRGEPDASVFSTACEGLKVRRVHCVSLTPIQCEKMKSRFALKSDGAQLSFSCASEKGVPEVKNE